jgi:hypothetical protein
LRSFAEEKDQATHSEVLLILGMFLHNKADGSCTETSCYSAVSTPEESVGQPNQTENI